MTEKAASAASFVIHQKQRYHQAFPHCRQLQSLSNFVHSPSRLIWDLHIFFPTFSRSSLPPVTSPSCSSDNCLKSFTFFSIISSFKKSKSKLQIIFSIIMPNYRRWKIFCTAGALQGISRKKCYICKFSVLCCANSSLLHKELQQPKRRRV